jgi:hypothetical protein
MIGPAILDEPVNPDFDLEEELSAAEESPPGNTEDTETTSPQDTAG